MTSDETRNSSTATWVIATSNPGKVREIAQILGPQGIAVRHLGQLDAPTTEPVEDGDTFEANAAIKARSYAAQLNARCLAEDSGLEVDALGGRPGVHSARYSGGTGPRDQVDQLNNRKLLSQLAEVPDEQRSARYVSAVCVADPDGSIVAQTRGTFEGTIAHAPRGEGGFGYDPLFVVVELGRTAAELTPEEKNARSHRGEALRKLGELL
jgi:XTP/dITP diphosphohydrolase